MLFKEIVDRPTDAEHPLITKVHLEPYNGSGELKISSQQKSMRNELITLTLISNFKLHKTSLYGLNFFHP